MRESKILYHLTSEIKGVGYENTPFRLRRAMESVAALYRLDIASFVIRGVHLSFHTSLSSIIQL